VIASFICAVCFEEIETVVDESQGLDQEYIEDCAVCCRPNVLRVHIEDGEINIDASFEE
jgi:hypothetical protein